MRRANAGFTLLEVLVALCIIAIAFGAIYRAQVQGIAMTGEARDVTYAGLLAQQKMAQLTSGLPPYGLRRGDFGRDFPGFSWLERVTGASEFGSEMRRVQVSVFWGPGDEARTLTLEGYVLEPSPESEEGAEEAPEEKAGEKAPEEGQAKEQARRQGQAADVEDEGGDEE